MSTKFGASNAKAQCSIIDGAVVCSGDPSVGGKCVYNVRGAQQVMPFESEFAAITDASTGYVWGAANYSIGRVDYVARVGNMMVVQTPTGYSWKQGDSTQIRFKSDPAHRGLFGSVTPEQFRQIVERVVAARLTH